jgi:hypothetical protein
LFFYYLSPLYSVSVNSSKSRSKPIKTFSLSERSPIIFLTGGGKILANVGVAKILYYSASCGLLIT